MKGEFIRQPVNWTEHVVLVAWFNVALTGRVFFPNMKVSHDFAVNFDEDNPECAGERADERTRLH